MNKTTTILSAVALGAAAIGISVAPPATADSSNCHTVGASIVCGQGGVKGGGQPAGALTAPVPAPAAGGCTTPYGTYQNCGATAG
jgi:hypothetical protein